MRARALALHTQVSQVQFAEDGNIRTRWLLRYIIEGLLGAGWHYLKEVMKAMLRKENMMERLERNSVGIQAHCCWTSQPWNAMRKTQ